MAKNILNNFIGQFIDNYQKGDDKRAFTMEEADLRWTNNEKLDYVIGENEILIDADNQATVDLMDTLIYKLGIQPYSYATNPEGSHKHYWFKATEFSHRALPMHVTHIKNDGLQIFNNMAIATVGLAADIKYKSTKTSSIVYLINPKKQKGQRPNATTLKTGIANTCGIPHIFCLNPTDVVLPPKGNVNNSLVGVATACARKQFTKEDFATIMDEWNKAINREGTENELVRAWENKADINPWKEVFTALKITYYWNSMWAILRDNTWVNLTEKFSDKTLLGAVVDTRIRDILKEKGIESDGNKVDGINITYNSMIGRAGLNYTNQTSFKGIVFRNGYLDATGWYPTQDIPFTTTQLDVVYDQNVEPDPIVEKFLNGLCGGNMIKRNALLKALSYALSNVNSGVFTYIKGLPGTGKGILKDMINQIVGAENNSTVDCEEAFGVNENPFGVRNINDKSFVWLEEFKDSLGKSSSNKLKKFVGEGMTVSINNKNNNGSLTPNTQTWLALSNDWPMFPAADDALKERIFAVLIDKKPDLTPEEWKYLAHGPADKDPKTWRGNPYFMNLLINAFYASVNDGKYRNAKFSIGEEFHLWDRQNSLDESYQWVTEPGNENAIVGRQLNEVYTAFKGANYNTKITNKMLKRTLEQNGYESHRTTLNGKRGYYYYKSEVKNG